MVPDNSAGIPRVPAYSGGPPVLFRFGYGALTPSGPAFQPVPLASEKPLRTPITPTRASRHRRFGLFPVRSPLLGESLLLSLPAGTKMFQFPAFAPSSGWCRDRSRRVAPFGNLRVYAHLPLAAAFRSLSRPSSPPRAKASSIRPCRSVMSQQPTSDLYFLRL